MNQDERMAAIADTWVELTGHDAEKLTERLDTWSKFPTQVGRGKKNWWAFLAGVLILEGIATKDDALEIAQAVQQGGGVKECHVHELIRGTLPMSVDVVACTIAETMKASTPMNGTTKEPAAPTDDATMSLALADGETKAKIVTRREHDGHQAKQDSQASMAEDPPRSEKRQEGESEQTPTDRGRRAVTESNREGERGACGSKGGNDSDGSAQGLGADAGRAGDEGVAGSEVVGFDETSVLTKEQFDSLLDRGDPPRAHISSIRTEPQWSTEWPGIGIVENMPAWVYHSIDALSSSPLRGYPRRCGGLLDSYAEYLAFSEDSTSEPRMDIGTASHGIVFEGLDSTEESLILVDKATRKNKDWENAQETAKPWQLPLLEKEWVRAQHCANTVLDHPTIRKMLTGARCELSIFWVEVIDGVEIRCKARIDCLTALGDLCDLKTTEGNIGDEGYHSKVVHERIPFQSAWYRRGARAAGLKGRENCYIWLAKSKAPYLPTVIHRIPKEDVDRCDHIIETGPLRLLAAHRKNPDRWQGYGVTADGKPAIVNHEPQRDWWFEKFEAGQ
jgi:hypothetical protein